MTQVDLVDLSKRYDAGVSAVEALTLSIPSGSVAALLGPSGCGKTTTLKMIAGLLAPTRGDVRFDGRSVLAIPAERRGAAMVFQNNLLFPFLSVGANVGFGLKMRGVPAATIRQRVGEMLERVQLPGYEGRVPNQLSGGQQQRVALARALVIEPEVLLLDEPLSNLDAHLRDEMRDLILRLQRALGITTIIVTHDQEEAVVLADRVALLFAGQLQQWGPPRDFYEQPISESVARFFGGVNFLPGTKRGEQVETALGRFHVPAAPAPDGPVTLTIRPESILLDADAPCNCIEAQIARLDYRGTHSRLTVAAGEHRFQVIGDAARSAQHRVGQTVRVSFPPEQLWAISDF